MFLLVQLQAFYENHAAFTHVTSNMKQNWEELGRHWAWWGRVSILDLAANTNNPMERGFGMLKYTHLNRNTQCTIQQLVDVIIGVWVPCSMKQREQQLAGRTCSAQRKQAERREDIVAGMVASGAVEPAPALGIPGLCDVKKLGGRGSVHACLGDLSCTCHFSGEA